ncbi:PREDICTED: prokineticin receptor 1-like [Branchiostoma belcheri]|uniref:Prokineticin receptor 1-like n=1 Tax=Branchiostoma belcheri TaxID=7741 RepID=A0A6P4ZCQ1_BRABE|nr:PREDICTED: prokineticin receptor 1-like [Branchiostoma belcheri]
MENLTDYPEYYIGSSESDVDYNWYEELFGAEETFSFHHNDTTEQRNLPDSLTGASTDPDVPVFMKAILGSVYTLTMITCGGINLILIYVIIQYKKMRNMTNMLIANLAMSDFLMAVICVPFVMDYYIVQSRVWTHGQTACAAVNYTKTMSLYVSTNALLVIAIDRYLVICHPSITRLTGKWAAGVVALAWLAAILFAVPAGRYSVVIPYHINEQVFCGQLWPIHEKERYRVYYLSVFVLEFALPVLMMIFCYSCILKKVCCRRIPGHQTSLQASAVAKSRLKAVRILVVILVLYIVCWGPYHVVTIIRDYYPEMLSMSSFNNSLMYTVEALAMGNSMMDTLVYIALNENIRSTMKHAPRDILQNYRQWRGRKVRPSIRSFAANIGMSPAGSQRSMRNVGLTFIAPANGARRSPRQDVIGTTSETEIL